MLEYILIATIRSHVFIQASLPRFEQLSKNLKLSRHESSKFREKRWHGKSHAKRTSRIARKEGPIQSASTARMDPTKFLAPRALAYNLIKSTWLMNPPKLLKEIVLEGVERKRSTI